MTEPDSDQRLWAEVMASTDATLVAGGPLSSRARRSTWAWPLTALSLVVAWLLVLPLVRMGMPLSIDFGEGWHAYLADELNRGRPIYAPEGSLTPNNYPPLSFHLVASLSRVTGRSSLMVGRAMSALALLIVALETWWVARRLGASRSGASFGALVFLGLVSGASARYVAMDDPQLLAQAAIGLGLIAYVRWPVPRHPGTIPATAGLIALGLLTKHNLVALPIALTLHVALVARQLWWRWCAALVVAVGGPLVLLEWQTGGRLVENMLSPRRYSLWTLVDVSRLAWLAMLVPVVVATTILWRRRRDRRVLLVGLYFIVAAVVGTVFSGGSGADVNMFFEAFVALSIASAMSMAGVEQTSAGFRIAGTATIAWLALALLVRGPTPARYDALRHRAADSVADVQFLRVHGGPAYCEQMLLCYWADKPLVLQPYFGPELMAAGVIADATVARLFETQFFRVVQLDQRIPDVPTPGEAGRPRKPSRLPAGLLRLIARRYQLTRTSTNGVFYVPTNPGNPAQRGVGPAPFEASHHGLGGSASLEGRRP